MGKDVSRLFEAPYSDVEVARLYRQALDQYSPEVATERAKELTHEVKKKGKRDEGFYRAIYPNPNPNNHPLIRFLDDLAAYLVSHPDRWIGHSNQALVDNLFISIYTKIDLYYSKSDRPGAPLSDFLADLRAEVWKAVRHLRKGEIHTAALLFLARTSTTACATDYVMPADKRDFNIEESIDSAAATSVKRIKAHFVKANQAARQNPAGAQAFLIWLSNLFMGLFRAAREEASLVAMPPPVEMFAAGVLHVDTSAPPSRSFAQEALSAVEALRRSRRGSGGLFTNPASGATTPTSGTSLTVETPTLKA